MSKGFAALAPLELFVLELLPAPIRVIVFFAHHLVLAELAALSIFLGLSAAPPHLARPLAAVRSTRPVIVLGVLVLELAVRACLDASGESLPFA